MPSPAYVPPLRRRPFGALTGSAGPGGNDVGRQTSSTAWSRMAEADNTEWSAFRGCGASSGGAGGDVSVSNGPRETGSGSTNQGRGTWRRRTARSIGKIFPRCPNYQPIEIFLRSLRINDGHNGRASQRRRLCNILSPRSAFLSYSRRKQVLTDELMQEPSLLTGSLTLSPSGNTP